MESTNKNINITFKKIEQRANEEVFKELNSGSEETGSLFSFQLLVKVIPLVSLPLSHFNFAIGERLGIEIHKKVNMI